MFCTLTFCFDMWNSLFVNMFYNIYLGAFLLPEEKLVIAKLQQILRIIYIFQFTIVIKLVFIRFSRSTVCSNVGNYFDNGQFVVRNFTAEDNLPRKYGWKNHMNEFGGCCKVNQPVGKFRDILKLLRKHIKFHSIRFLPIRLHYFLVSRFSIFSCLNFSIS